jgi:basic membrane lipoprotein Med (substrate-binding protein (PBP1-ABC) superfamily)
VFSRGEPDGVKALCSHSDDVTLANPFGPAVRGWEQVAARLDYASSRFSGGEVTQFERLAAYPGLKAVLVDYAGSFLDQNKGRDVGLKQIWRGADTLFAVAGTAGLGYMAAARERGVYAIGVDVDQSSLGSYVLTSALLREDTAVYDVVRDAAEHRFRGGTRTFGVAQSGVGIGKMSRIVPPSIVRIVAMEATKIQPGLDRVGS